MDDVVHLLRLEEARQVASGHDLSRSEQGQGQGLGPGSGARTRGKARVRAKVRGRCRVGAAVVVRLVLIAGIKVAAEQCCAACVTAAQEYSGFQVSRGTVASICLVG